MTRVVNVREESCDVFIGRPGWFGNPFIIGRDGNREEVIYKMDNWLRTGNNFGCAEATEERRQWVLGHLSELKGQRLGCFCEPLPCHGNIYVRIMEEKGNW